MVTGADGHAARIDQGPDVVGMGDVQGERQNPERVVLPGP